MAASSQAVRSSPFSFSKSELDMLQEIFSIHCQAGKGHTISFDDVGNILRKLGKVPTEKELLEIRNLDGNATGRLDWVEFLVIASKLFFFDAVTHRQLNTAFRMFDESSSGLIDAFELRRALTTLGEKLTKEEVDDLIRKAEPNKHMMIDYKKFVKAMVSAKVCSFRYENYD